MDSGIIQITDLKRSVGVIKNSSAYTRGGDVDKGTRDNAALEQLKVE